MKLTDINIRDPFVLTYNGKYYMYGTRAKNTWSTQAGLKCGFDVYESYDLVEWSEPKSIFEASEDYWGKHQFWAPEAHLYNGKFYLFASFKSDTTHRGTATLVCDTPNGEFKPLSNGAVTPKDWACLDGTLYVENGTPYIVFCHEWTQIEDGEVCAQELSKDLSHTVGEPIILWKASMAKPWVVPHDGKGSYVTDGPFVMNIDGELICLWSSFGKYGYVEAISRSDNGKITGKWTIDEKLLFEKNGGHGMIFEDLDGNLNFIYHSPNETPLERPCIRKIQKEMLMRR